MKRLQYIATNDSDDDDGISFYEQRNKANEVGLK